MVYLFSFSGKSQTESSNVFNFLTLIRASVEGSASKGISIKFSVCVICKLGLSNSISLTKRMDCSPNLFGTFRHSTVGTVSHKIIVKRPFKLVELPKVLIQFLLCLSKVNAITISETEIKPMIKTAKIWLKERR